jgi:predicted nucleic acid-binding protein
MAEALVDSNVLFAFRNSDDQYHDRARAIVEGIDEGELPRGIVTSYVFYSFDDDFDEFESITRLTTADNPFGPESST